MYMCNAYYKLYTFNTVFIKDAYYTYLNTNRHPFQLLSLVNTTKTYRDYLNYYNW